MTNDPPPAPQNDHSSDSRTDPAGTIRRLTNGAIVVKRDRSLRSGMMWLVVMRPDGMTNAALYDDELGFSEVIGAMPFTPAASATTLTVTDSVKMLRETFCVAQTYIGLSCDPRAGEHVDRLQRLADECDRHRPLGPDGKHGHRHTPTCGCDADEHPTGATR